jgi:hypothetical protein
MENETAQPDSQSRYDRLAQVFSRVYAETHSVATALEVLDAHRAREAIARPIPDLPKQVLTVAASLWAIVTACWVLLGPRHGRRR